MKRKLLWVVLCLMLGCGVVRVGPAWGAAAKPQQVKLQKAPAMIEGVSDPIVTVSPTVLTLKAGEQGTVTWTVQVPATEPTRATDILWTWPHPDGFIAVSGRVEQPGYTIPGYSISNQAIVTWDGGGYAESPIVTVEVLPVDVPAVGIDLFMSDGTWNAWIDEITPGNLATVAITLGAP